jgi:hypothetical protein
MVYISPYNTSRGSVRKNWKKFILLSIMYLNESCEMSFVYQKIPFVQSPKIATISSDISVKPSVTTEHLQE